MCSNPARCPDTGLKIGIGGGGDSRFSTPDEVGVVFGSKPKQLRTEYHIPECAGEAVSPLQALRLVVREMVPLEIAKVRISEVVKVNGMMCPLLGCIARDDASQECR